MRVFPLHSPLPLVGGGLLRHNWAMLMSAKNKAAKLHYMPNNFRLLSGGDHVVCAVSGAKIMLEDLRYWSIARQEPYASAELSLKAEQNSK